MNKTNEIIKKCGGALVIAEAVGLTVQAIYKWRKKNNIPQPQKYFYVLKELADQRGETVEFEDFL